MHSSAVEEVNLTMAEDLVEGCVAFGPVGSRNYRTGQGSSFVPCFYRYHCPMDCRSLQMCQSFASLVAQEGGSEDPTLDRFCRAQVSQCC